MSEMRFPDDGEDGIEIVGAGTDEQKTLAVVHTGFDAYVTSGEVVSAYSEIL